MASSLETVRCLHTALVPLGNSVLLVDPAPTHPIALLYKMLWFSFKTLLEEKIVKEIVQKKIVKEIVQSPTFPLYLF